MEVSNLSKKEAKEKRVDDILDAAIDVFIEKGYENTSMNEIALRAGMSKGGLYHHFLSKDMILLYANQKLMEPCNEMLKAATENPLVKDGLNQYIYEYLKFWKDRKKALIFFSLSMTKAMTHMDIFKMYENYTEDNIRSFEALFKKGITTGEFVTHDCRGSAIALMSALDGLIVYMALDKKLTLQDMSRTFEDIFLKPIYQSHAE